MRYKPKEVVERAKRRLVTASVRRLLRGVTRKKEDVSRQAFAANETLRRSLHPWGSKLTVEDQERGRTRNNIRR